MGLLFRDKHHGAHEGLSFAPSLKRLKSDEPQADEQCFIDLAHCGSIYCPETLHKALAVHGTDLVQNDRRGFRQSAFPCGKNYFARVRRIAKLRTYDSHNRDRAVLVRDIILDDERGPGFLDFMADSGIKGNKVDFATPRKAHSDFGLRVLERRVRGAGLPAASSSNGNHPAAIATSRSALASASRLRRSRSMSFPWTST